MGLYSDHTLDEVRNSANIVAWISEYVALKKRGKNHVARCPFHTEKTPSFSVNEEKQIFHCFGCGVGGDIFKFLMQVEHISFPESVRMVAERHGIDLPKLAPAPGETPVDTDALRGAMAEAAAFFRRALADSDEGRAAGEYLQKRGVSPESVDRFQLGFAPAGGKLLSYLQGKGYTIAQLLDCGLAKTPETDRPYDAFRGRIMFPIRDVQGRIIAFGGRAMGDQQPKYLNSPETKLYNKSRNLFGLNYSREGIKKHDFAVLVEGYMDFLIPFQSGIENVVASLGTSLTPQQVKLLGRYTREVVVSYDPDSAGVTATQRSLDLFLEEDFRVKVLRLPEGEDPDAFIRNSGVEEYRIRLRQSIPYLDFVVDLAIRSQGILDSPRKKVQVLNAVLPYLAKLPNAVERSDYVFQFARKIEIEDKLLLAEVKRAAQQKKTRIDEEPKDARSAMGLSEKRLLQALLGEPALQARYLPDCGSQDFEGLATEKIFGALLERFKRGEVSTFEDLQRVFQGTAEQALLAQAQMEEQPRLPETPEDCMNALRHRRLDSYKQQILSKIAEAEKRKDEEMLNRLYEQRMRVDRELVSLSRK